LTKRPIIKVLLPFLGLGGGIAEIAHLSPLDNSQNYTNKT
jgi:hypothetical protein